ncbi:tRNA (guanosine(46)-N7)-methyltransferase TrmB [Thiotrichales bacterium 19S11-10]|nr:tRNA (guanosine(46)-N7)-methyltransferase TrmB [Thiotrichales bacterium 19S11-10]
MTDKNNRIDISERPLRTVKSFVKRQGRLTKAQARALEKLSGLYMIDFQNKLANLSSFYANDQPVVIEIGFGMGDSLVQMAKENQGINYLGIEVHEPGVGNILNLIDHYQLENLKVINHDAVDVIKEMIKDQSVLGFQIFFPDPWHKKRHHKRRLIQPEFVDLISSKLKQGGFIHCATDWQHYAEHMLEVLLLNKLIKNQHDSYAPRPKSRPLTKFEKRGERLSHGVWDLIFYKA